MTENTTFGINDFRIGDLPTINRLLSQSSLFHENIDISWVLESMRKNRFLICARCLSREALLENDQGVIISMAMLIPEKDHSKIEAMVTDVRFRRLGIGTKLMYLATEKARSIGASFVEIKTNFGDYRAISFFESLGFEIIEKPGQDFLNMRLDFEREEKANDR